MNYLSKKVNSFAGEALSGVNEMRRKMRNGASNPTSERAQQQSTSAIDNSRSSDQVFRIHQRLPADQYSPYHHQQRYATNMTTGAAAAARSPLAGGTPFGGDFYTSTQQPPPPAIGFRTDLLPARGPSAPSTGIVVTTTTTTTSGPAQAATTDSARLPQKPPSGQRLGDSSESLYQADAWARLWFPRVMILCLLRMLLFIRKLYEDFQATKVYNLTGHTGFLLISAATLFLPTIIFTLYRVSRYLQLVLPPLRAKGHAMPPVKRPVASSSTPAQATAAAAASSSSGHRGNDDDEAQLTRALMTSSPESVTSGDRRGEVSTPPQQQDDDAASGGLVTARQSPSQPGFEELNSSTSGGGGGDVRATVAQPKETTLRLESINMDKLGDLPDKDTVRVFVGASEQFLHGILFVFWQLKRQVDVMGYLVERACIMRKPADAEKEEIARLRMGSDGLEWFQDFYAAFLAILAQVYMLSAHWSGTSGSGQLSASDFSAPLAGVAPPPPTPLDTTSPPGTSGGDSSSSGVISNSARIIGSLFGTQALTGHSAMSGGQGTDVLLVSELVVSSFVILSLLTCVGRRDDGIMTRALSMLGWGSLFAARIIIIGLAFVHIHWHIMLPLVALHVLAITGWIYSIALASHNDAPGERCDEAEWDEEAAVELAGEQQQAGATAQTSGGAETLELAEQSTAAAASAEGQAPGQSTQSNRQAATQSSTETSSWSALEHLVLLTQILTLFAIPSLFYWPVMFNLKLHLRPFKYLVLILIENFLLIPAIWMAISNGGHVGGVSSQVAAAAAASSQPSPAQLYLLGAVGAFSVLGFIFVSLYIACKPSLTEYFARADELFNEAKQSGIYYEFCSRVFKMADLSKESFRRLMNQSEVIVEERYELVSEIVKDSADDPR